MLVVPWPLTNTAPAAVGTVHCTDAAFAGILANVYVNTLPPASPQNAICTTSITLGVAGFSLVIDNVLAALVPQPFVAVTLIEPLVNPDGYVKLIVFVPWPVTFKAPDGTAQLYVTPGVFVTEYVAAVPPGAM